MAAIARSAASPATQLPVTAYATMRTASSEYSTHAALDDCFFFFAKGSALRLGLRRLLVLEGGYLYAHRLGLVLRPDDPYRRVCVDDQGVVVADDYELRLPRHLLYELRELLRVLLVQRRVYLVEEVDRGRLAHVYREEQHE